MISRTFRPNVVFGETCRHVIPINFKNRFIKFPPGNQARRQTYQTQKKKNSTNQPVDILFQKNGHVFGFPFRVNYSKLELRISTIISHSETWKHTVISPRHGPIRFVRTLEILRKFLKRFYALPLFGQRITVPKT